MLAAWSGLGYYRRARMMHAAAKVIVKQHGGKFPGGIGELRALPGIGRYTSAAIASIVFNAPAAVVDGNVERVLKRAFGTELAGESLWQAAELVAQPPAPWRFQSGDDGARLDRVPAPPASMRRLSRLSSLCATRGTLDAPRKATSQRRRNICYALDHRDGSIFLVQRPKHASLMPGMWELPEIPASSASGEVSITVRHSITVTDYTVRVMRRPAPGKSQGRWVLRTRVPQLPLTGLARKILKEAQVI